MRIVQLTPGTGNFYCGHCLRDNALALALRKRGHDVLMVPLYLPSVTDEPDAGAGTPIFFGGLNVYLDQKMPFFRLVPERLTRVLDSPSLLRAAAGSSSMTSADDLGELTVSMLRGEEGRQVRELRKLIAWLKTQPKPEIICLSTALLSGLARELKQQFNTPVVCTLQGEDTFLDSLPERQRAQSWKLLSERAADIDVFIAVSAYFADVMGRRIGLAPGRLEVVHNGINLDGFEPAASPPAPPALGFLARMSKSKGLDTLVAAFIELRRRDRIPGLKLRIAGAMTPSDEVHFVNKLKGRLHAESLFSEAEWFPNIDRRQKQEFLRTVSVLSVPATYGEAFGLYVLEALACGVPVVQPRHAAFPEIIEQTGGGVLCEPNDPSRLADALEALLLDPARAWQLGRQGRQAVREHFSVERMAGNVEDVLRAVAARVEGDSGPDRRAQAALDARGHNKA